MNKATVKCKCGSAFSAPASLVGQVVKCPVCGEAMRVPEPGGGSAGGAAGGSARNASRTGPSGIPGSAGGTAAGRSAQSTRSGTAMRSAARKAIEQADDEDGLSLCPRCRQTATSGGRLCTTCLYELHTGERAGPRRKFKLTLGFAASLAVLVGAVGVGFYIVLHSYGGHTSPHHPAAAGTTNTGGGSTAGLVADNHAAARQHNATTPSAGSDAQVAQSVEAGNRWTPPTSTAGYARIDHTTVDAKWQPEHAGERFTVTLVPRGSVDQAGLTMAANVVLYRSASKSGPFTQVDRGQPADADSDTLTFKLRDQKAATLGANRAYYRLSGNDGQGKRLFDTPAAAFPVLRPMRIVDGRLKWRPIAAAQAASPPPPVRCVFSVDAPGWEDVVLAQVAPEGALDQPLPAVASKLPVQAVMEAGMPVGIDLAGDGSGQWRRGMVKVVVQKAEHSGSAPPAVTPAWANGGLRPRVLPNKNAFTKVSRTSTHHAVIQRPSRGGERKSGAQGSAAPPAFTFTPKGRSTPQSLDLPRVARPRDLVATPFDGRVRLSWDNTSLRSAKDRYEGGVAVAIYRRPTAGGQAWSRLATVGADQSGFIDDHASNGQGYRYELRLVEAGGAEAPARMHAQAWVSGLGKIPVLVNVRPRRSAGPVAAEAGLDRLRVAIGPSELAYPYTGKAAMNVLQAVRHTLMDKPRAAVIERDEMKWSHARRTAGGRDTGSAAVSGAPAQVSLCVTDAPGSGGGRIALWAADLVSGQTRKLAQAPAGDVDPRRFVASLTKFLKPRMPQSAPPAADLSRPPGRLIVGPLIRTDQPQPYFGARRLMRKLTSAVSSQDHDVTVKQWRAVRAAAQSGEGPGASGPAGGTLRLEGRVWRNEKNKPAVLVHAVDARSGRLLASFEESAVGPQTPGRFSQWAMKLRLPATPSTSENRTGASGSALLRAEANLQPMNPLWRQMAGGGGGRGRPGSRFHLRPHGVVLALGTPLPPSLRPYQPPRRRSPRDPLSIVRPYVVSPRPAMFDQWARRYAAWVKTDYEAFQQGLREAAGALHTGQGAVKPQFIVRGRPTLTGRTAIKGAVPPTADPRLLNLRGLFTQGPSGEPLVNYRRDLDKTFTRRPWAAYQAWKSVSPKLARPFLKTQLYGVGNDEYKPIDMTFMLAPDFKRYVAAVLLGEMGDSVGRNFQRRAIQRASHTLHEVMDVKPGEMTPHQREYVTNAMLVLLFEQDPGTLQLLQQPDVLDRYVSVKPDRTADIARLLVDRLGEVGWQWAAHQPGMNWSDFIWRSKEDMRTALHTIPDALPHPLSRRLRAWMSKDGSPPLSAHATANAQP